MLREKGPLTMCVQNYVAMDFSANVLLAAGASPAMVDANEECDPFTMISSALSLNVGTALSPHWIQAMLLSADAANKYKKPWSLDPVGCGATPHRNAVCAQVMEKRPTVVRGNASEIMALASVCKLVVSEGTQSGGGKGVDSTNGSDEAIPAAIALAKHYGCIVAVSGAVDVITDGSVKVLVHNGQEMLTKITGAGCSLSALCAAYCAVSQLPLDGVVAAFVHFTVASDLAAAMPEVKGPGTLRTHLLDQLYLVTPELLAQHMKIEIVSM